MTDAELRRELIDLLEISPVTSAEDVASSIGALLSRLDDAELELDMVRTELAVLQKPDENDQVAGEQKTAADHAHP